MLVTVDANILFGDPFLKGAGATAAKIAAPQLGFQLALTEVVLAEALGKFAQRVKDTQGKFKALSRELTELGFNSPQSAPSQPEIDAVVHKYPSALEAVFPEETRIPFPNVSLQTLVERAVSKRRPFREEDKGFRDTLIWLSLLVLLKTSDDSIVFITNDEGFRKDKGTNDVHPDLLDDLAQEGIEPEGFILYRSLNEFVDKFVSPKLESLEEIRVGIESGSIKLPDEVEDSVATNLWEYSLSLEFDSCELGIGDALGADVDVIEDVTLDEVESAELLPGGDILVRCSWQGEITLIAYQPGYQKELVSRPFRAVVKMILKPDTFELATMDVLEFELIEPSYY